MGQAGGSWGKLSRRLMRHFHLFSIPKPSDEAVKTIFSRIMLWHLDTRGFSKEFDPCIDEIVEATKDVYSRVLEKLKPTPLKYHYVFNLRDFSRVIQGVLMSVPETMEDRTCMYRLWVHETMRVFGDRLSEPEDSTWLATELMDVVNNHLQTSWEEIFAHLNISQPEQPADETILEKLIFCDFADPKSEAKNYIEVQDMEHLRTVVEGYMEEYNNTSKRPLHLYMFRYAMEHLCRISRIVKQPFSHALLIGEGGCGRQALTRLAIGISGGEVYEIEGIDDLSPSRWREELKKVLTKATAVDQNAILLISNVEATVYWDDLNQLLRIGDIPNLHTAEEKAEIIENMRTIDQSRDKSLQTDGSNAALLKMFVSRIHEQLHIVWLIDAGSEFLRRRLQEVPTLLNNCIMDWFLDWPEDSLEEAAEMALSDVPFEQTERKVVFKALKHFHVSAIELNETLKEQEKKSFPATPPTFLGMLHTYKALLTSRRREVMTRKSKYQLALAKVSEAESQIGEMELAIEEKEPLLKLKAQQVEEFAKTVEENAKEVAEKEGEVLQEEEEVQDIGRKADELEEQWKEEVEPAYPPLNDAISLLKSLNPPDILALKGMKNPPAPVKLVLEAVCILMGRTPDRVTDPNAPGKLIEDWWNPAKRLLSDAALIKKLVAYATPGGVSVTSTGAAASDTDHTVDEATAASGNLTIVQKEKAVEAVRKKHIQHPDFNPKKVEQASTAAKAMCLWVIAVENYYRVERGALPKREAFEVAKDEYDKALAHLKERQAALKEAQDSAMALQNKLDAWKNEKGELDSELDMTNKKLARARQLIEGLGNERGRWAEVVKDLEQLYKKSTGDVALVAAFLRYLGPLDYPRRLSQLSAWDKKTCLEMHLPCSDIVDPLEILENDAEAAHWQACGLPSDDVYIQNAHMLNRVRDRWPCLIDPDSIGMNFIKAWEKGSNLHFVKFDEPEYMTTLENCIQFGHPVMVELDGRGIDPALDALMTKQTFQQSGSTCIKVGDSIVEYSPEFRIYFILRERRTHFSPPMIGKFNLIDFSMTKPNLHEVVMSMVVGKENPDLEEEKRQTLSQTAENRRQKKELEEKILEVLTSSEGNILDDESGVKVLTSSKFVSEELKTKEAAVAAGKARVTEARAKYNPVAAYVVTHFFTLLDFVQIRESCYSFGVEWFVDLFRGVLEDQSPAEEDPQARLVALKSDLTVAVFHKIGLQLFEQDLEIFPFLLAINLGVTTQALRFEEYELFLKNLNCLLDEEIMSSCREESNFSRTTSARLRALGFMHEFQDLYDNVKQNEESWLKWTAGEADTVPWIENKTLSTFQALLLRQCFRPGTVVTCLKKLLKEMVGERAARILTAPITWNVNSTLDGTSSGAPILLPQLASGGDASELINAMVLAKNMATERVKVVSLGMEQVEIALKSLETGAKEGHWILLQNTHLSIDFLSTVERFLDGLTSENTHPEFRLWISFCLDAMDEAPDEEEKPAIPVSVLQRASIIAADSKLGLRFNMSKCYSSKTLASREFWDSVRENPQLHRTALCFSVFHCLLHERMTAYRSFTSVLGDDVNFQDFSVAVQQLSDWQQQASWARPWMAFLVCEWSYGGRTGSNMDRRFLRAFFNHVLDLGYDDDSAEILLHLLGAEPEKGRLQPPFDLEDVTRLVESLPVQSTVKSLLLPESALVLRNIDEVENLVNAGRKVQRYDCPWDTLDVDLLEKLVLRLTRTFPEKIDPIRLTLSEKNDQEADHITVAMDWEVQSYNALLAMIHDSLREVGATLSGETVMTPLLHRIMYQMSHDQVPEAWDELCYPHPEDLDEFTFDLISRLMYMEDLKSAPALAHKSTPVQLSGMFSPARFLGAVTINFAAKLGVNPSDVVFELQGTASSTDETDAALYINGLYLEGADWDVAKACLKDATLAFERLLPTLTIIPKVAPTQGFIEGFFLCPVYEQHRSTYICSHGEDMTGCTVPLATWYIPTDKPDRHWILKGVAINLRPYPGGSS